MGASEIIPFGKYRGQPMEILAQDKEYREWLMGQDWFRERYSGIHTLIVNNFGTPSETPEHNTLQARFVDKEWVNRLATRLITWNHVETWWRHHSKCGDSCCGPNERAGNLAALASRAAGEPPVITTRVKAFEDHGADVVIDVRLRQGGKDDGSTEWRIECKPSVGDDYPAILRQMKASQCILLLIGDGGYIGTGATYEQVKSIFAFSNIRIVRLDEIPAAEK